jgi:hypothetical protein
MSKTSGVMAFYQYQIDALKAIETSMWNARPIFLADTRKGWESKYDPKFTERRSVPAGIPHVSTLPSNLWVLSRGPEGLQTPSEYNQAVAQWLAVQKLKHQTCVVIVGDKVERVHLFKKIKDAVMFKLAWG